MASPACLSARANGSMSWNSHGRRESIVSREPSPTEPADQPVGYKRPPAQHQFKKGVSGNPRGRPPKAGSAQPPPTPYTALDDIVLSEALRPIQIRENDQLVEIPMIQAVVRSLGVGAVKGSHRSQLALAGMVKAIQTAQHEGLLELYKAAVEYQQDWRERF